MAFVQGAFGFAEASSQSSLPVGFAGNCTTGNLVAVFINYGTATSVFGSITDSQSNTYTAVDSIAGGAGGSGTSKTFYAKNITGGANSVTLNFTGSTGVFPRMLILEYSGLDTSASVLNAHEIANQDLFSGSGADAYSSAGSASTTSDGCTIVGFWINRVYSPNLADASAGTSFTLRTTGNTASNNFDRYQSEDRVQLTAGSVHATFTPAAHNPSGEYFSTAMMAFQPPAASTVFIPLIGRGPGLQLAGGRGLAG